MTNEMSHGETPVRNGDRLIRSFSGYRPASLVVCNESDDFFVLADLRGRPSFVDRGGRHGAELRKTRLILQVSLHPSLDTSEEMNKMPGSKTSVEHVGAARPVLV